MFLASWLDRRSANGREGAPLFTSFQVSQTEHNEGALAHEDQLHAKTIPVNRLEHLAPTVRRDIKHQSHYTSFPVPVLKPQIE